MNLMHASTACGSIVVEDLQHFGDCHDAEEVNVMEIMQLLDLRNVGVLNIADIVNLAIAVKTYLPKGF